jgi:hypothetical protein
MRDPVSRTFKQSPWPSRVSGEASDEALADRWRASTARARRAWSPRRIAADLPHILGHGPAQDRGINTWFVAKAARG